VIDYKKQFGVEQEGVLDMLSDNLKVELIVQLNGSLLHDSPVFKNFNVVFLSQLTVEMVKETFTNEDMVFEEYELGTKIYFITNGDITLLHKRTRTKIKTLQ
jgi:hypothetical protein